MTKFFILVLGIPGGALFATAWLAILMDPANTASWVAWTGGGIMFGLSKLIESQADAERHAAQSAHCLSQIVENKSRPKSTPGQTPKSVNHG